MAYEKLLKRTERTLQAMAEEADRLTPKQQALLRLLYSTPSPTRPNKIDRSLRGRETVAPCKRAPD